MVANELIRSLARNFTRSVAKNTQPNVALRVTDGDGNVLVDIARAERQDYRLMVSLPSGLIMVDLYEHYRRFAEVGGKTAYRGTDFACNTYVKFGECIQDRRELHVLIQATE